MSAGPSIIESVVGHEFETIATGGVAAVLLFVFGTLAVKKLQATPNATIPDSKLSLRNFFELIAEFMVSLGDLVMGKHNRKYLPFAAAIFLFILTMNLMGLVPGLGTPTDNFTFNMGMAAVVFVMYHYWGVREVGFIPYLKHFGIVHVEGNIIVVFFMTLLWVLLFCIETISHFIRPLTLSLRLFGNMTGDHAVLGAFTAMTDGSYVPVPVVFYFMGTFVCFLQAFIFTLLSMIYIRLSVAHEETEEAH